MYNENFGVNFRRSVLNGEKLLFLDLIDLLEGCDDIEEVRLDPLTMEIMQQML